ncbi:MAG: hypothetical protein JNM18_05580 [Planctomycetaceae bacterium]|nr:hypothetical protein [Planctomycetaceae bacterium]
MRSVPASPSGPSWRSSAIVVVGWLVGLTMLVGCAGRQLNSRVDSAFLKKVADDPFPSAAEKGVLPAPK